MIRWLRDLMRRSKQPPTDFATAVQIEFIQGVCGELGREPPDNLGQLTGGEAADIIDGLMFERAGGEPLNEEPPEPMPGPR